MQRGEMVLRVEMLRPTQNLTASAIEIRDPGFSEHGRRGSFSPSPAGSGCRSQASSSERKTRQLPTLPQEVFLTRDTHSKAQGKYQTPFVKFRSAYR